MDCGIFVDHTGVDARTTIVLSTVWRSSVELSAHGSHDCEILKTAASASERSRVRRGAAWHLPTPRFATVDFVSSTQDIVVSELLAAVATTRPAPGILGAPALS